MITKYAEFLKKQWREWRGIIIVVTFIIVPLRSSVADWNWVPTGSMNPTILEGDMVYVNKLAYDFRAPLTLHSLKHISNPDRGDICVLLSPDDNTRLVKRVIGLPGDTLELSSNLLSINGSPLIYTDLKEEKYAGLEDTIKRNGYFAEEYLGDAAHAVMAIKGHSAMRSFAPVTIPENHYFVMGDNRDNSKDSRCFGFVERKQFLGEATRVIVSFNKLDKLQPRGSRFFTKLN